MRRYWWTKFVWDGLNDNTLFLIGHRISVCETQQGTNHAHNLHCMKYLVLDALFHEVPTSQKQPKQLRSQSAWCIMRWKIFFAFWVGCFDRAWYGFKIWQLWNSVNVYIVAVDMYATLLVDVACMYATLLVDLICMRGKRWPDITRWIGQTFPRYRTQDTSGEWKVYISVFS